jgi:hypothetical protein
MKRLPVFLLLGPVFGVLVAFSHAVIVSGGIPGDTLQDCTIVFVFSLIVSVMAGPVDAILGYAVPISLRAPLTAIVGAVVAVGLILYVGAQLGGIRATPLLTLVLVAVLGALSMGACSVLSHDYRR